MTRSITLAAIKAGITRLRIKGGASPESLYDLKNGYVTAARTVKPRPGSATEATLPSGKTIGLTLLDDVFQVFTSDPTVTGIPEGYALNIMIHPLDKTLTLKRIWKAARYMGYLFVVAEFSNGDVYYYWLQKSTVWQPSTVYPIGAVVEPTVANGYAYRAHRVGEPGILWAPGVARALEDKVEPTEANGYEYTVVEIQGSNPRSGSVEPEWLTSDGALVYEDVDTSTPPPPTPPPAQPPDTKLPPDVYDRYGEGRFSRSIK